MRRIAAIILVLGAATAGAAGAMGGTAQGSQDGRFDVIFDDARGLVAGQLVKIAGAQAGTIVNVVVTPDFKARIEANVDSRFLPFHRDATCSIRPQGLIAENYVECDPGSSNSPPLKVRGGIAPTVPVARTTEPVSLLDLFNIFNDPTRQRLTMLINELGISTSARGQDINEVLRRANPSLALARQVIGILDRQRSQLATIADATSTIAAEGAAHTGDVQSFLTRAAGLTALTASHRTALARTVSRLPTLLAAAQPALTRLDTLAVDATPLVRQIHTAVPSLNRVAGDLSPFAEAARRGLTELSGALSKAIPALHDTAPLLRTLRGYADQAKPGTIATAKLVENLQRHGFVENFLSVVYYIGASLARYDSTSHMLAILLISPGNGACGNYATTPVAACSAHYGTQSAYTPVASDTRARRGASSTATGSAKARGPVDPGSSGGAATAGAGAEGGSGPVAGGSGPVAGGSGPVAGGPAAPPSAPGAGTLQSLVNYLLK